MAQTKTEWVLKLSDKITAPIKSMASKVKEATGSVYGLSDGYRFTKKEIKEAIANSIKYHKDLQVELRENEKKLKDLEKAYDKATPGRLKADAKKVFEKQRNKVERFRKALVDAEKDMADLNKQMQAFSESDKRWAATTITINQTAEVLSKMSRSLNFAVDVKKLTTDVQRMTDLAGDELSDFVSKSREIADVYDDNAMEVAKSANMLTKQLGGTYESNLALLEAGYKKGGNLQGDYLSTLQKFAPALYDMGVSADEAIAMIVQANKAGVESDKFIEGIRNAGVAITKLGSTEAKVLEKVGINFRDLEGKTPIEAIQTVVNAMEGATEQAKQNVISKIFKKAGEDSGVEFIMGMSEGMPNLLDMPEVEEAAAGFKSFFSEMKSFAGDILGGFATYAQQIAPVIQLMAGAIPIFTMIRNSTMLATAAQWAYNLALSANPIGVIIAAIVLLVGWITLIIKKWDSWGASINLIMAVFTPWLSLIIGMVKTFYDHWDSIVQAFKDGGILTGLKRIGAVLLDVLLKPVEQLLNGLSRIPGLGGLAAKGADAISKIRENLELKTEKEEKKKQVKEEGVNALLSKEPTKITYNTDGQALGKGPAGQKDGLNVGSGAGGVKSIAMTLNVENHFDVDKNTNIRNIADQIVAMVNDRLKDSLVTIN